MNMKKDWNLKLPDSEIISAEPIKAGSLLLTDSYKIDNMPAFLRLILRSRPGKKSLINTEVWLPDNWNGIFIGLGNGGMAGTIDYGALAKYTRKGYACANTDMGTSLGVESGIDNHDVWKDFGWRSTHIMTELGKSLLRKYYGKNERYSYFIGASTGGQQAFSEAQRFPCDYDGIIAAVPANNRVFLHTYFLWNHVHLRTKDGRVLFNEEEVSRITDFAAAFFQSRGDGEVGDRFVSFPYSDENTVKDFIAFLRSEAPDFSDEQLEALRAVYSGPENPKTGEQIYNGMPIGSEIYDCGILRCAGEKSPYFYPFIWAFGKDYCGYDFDFSDALYKISEKLSSELNANSDDLEAFYKRGSKLIAYSGSADPCVPYPDAMQYYNRVVDKMGKKTVKSFFKYFLLPGRDHSRGGRGVNREGGRFADESLLDALRVWRENGIEPEYMTVTRQENGETVFERKIVPYEADRSAPQELPRSCCENYLNM